jgi:transcription elongation factor GreA
MRISEIETILDSYEILDIDHKAKKNHTVTIGSTFTLDVDGTKKIYTLVGSTEANILQNRISNESPIGMAVIGKSAGEAVNGVAHSGTFEYKLIDIK